MIARVRTLCLASSLAIVATALPARDARADRPQLEPSQEQRALALYEEGSKLLQRGDPAASLGPFERSMELLPSPNTELLIGHALRQLGKNARAVERYVHVRETAKARVAAGEARFAPTRDDAERWIGALTPRVADLTVNVGGASDAAVLHVNDRRVGWLAGSTGAVRAARSFEEPGRARVEVRSPAGEVLAASDVELTRGAAKLVTLEVAASVASSGAPATSDGAAHQEGGIAPPPVAAWIAGGVGVAGMISFAVAGGVAISSADTLDACAPRCDPGDPALADARDTGNTAATVANVSVAIGAAGLVSGALLWIFWPEEETPTSRLTLDVGPASVGLRGRF